MTKREYEEIKKLIDNYDNAEEGNDALVTMVYYVRKLLKKYEEKHKIINNDKRSIRLI